MNLYILCLLVIAQLVHPEIIHRLSTKQKSTLNENDYIYSTLGYFRLRLISPSCQIRIQEFNVIDYEVKGYFPYDPFLVSCSFITIQSGILKTEQQVPLIKIKNFQTLPCRETTLTINDMGVIILTCIIYDEKSINQEQVKSQSQWVTTFRTLNRFIYPVLKATVTTNDVLQLKSNDGGWGFSSRNGQFRIFYKDDPRKISKFRYHGFELGPGKILDKSGFGDIFFSIDGFNYLQRCSMIKYRQFNYPIVFVMNSFWPELRVLDQGGYQLMSFRYPNYNCRIDLGINPIEYQKQCISWFCPQGTFQFEGDCVLKCPPPYFHQIKTNMKNRCVLICEEGSFVDEIERVCTCNDMSKKQKCEGPSKNYPLGCYCLKSSQQQLYYNGFSCLNICPLGYIQLSLAIEYNNNEIGKRSAISSLIPTQFGGVCIKCPYKCLICHKYSIPVNYLECIECMDGYTLFEGFCKKQCKLDNFPNSNSILIKSSLPTKTNITKNVSTEKNISKAKSQKNSLLKCFSKCQIQYCQLCQLPNSNENIKSTVSITNNKSNLTSFEEKQTCLKCDRPYILHKNVCIKKCPSEYIMRVTSTLHLECEQLQKCQQRYPNRNINQAGYKSVLQISILSADPLDYSSPPADSPPLAKKLKSSPQPQSSQKYVHGIYSSTIIVNQEVNYTSCTQCKLQPYGICWIECDKSSYFNNQSSCFCYVGYDSTYNHRYGFKSSCMLENNQNETLNSTNVEKQCPYNYYLYKQTLQCLSCPFGCLTCIHDSYGVIWCTSCGPSYYLKINLNTFVGYICQRDSSLVSCQNTTKYTFYDSQNKVCTSITENNKTVYNKRDIANKSNEQIISELIGLYATNRVLCRKNDPYCLICLEYSLKICTFCMKGYYLYNQKCYRNCPVLTISYQRVCIKIDVVLPHCKKTQVKEHVYLMNISQINMNQQGYLYFARPLTIGLDLVIDPIGNPLNYISIHGRDIGYRIGQYPYPILQCKQCKEYYGMNPQTLICESCQDKHCIHCPSNIQNICFKCSNDYKLDQNNRCIQKREEQKNCNHNEYRNDQGICVRDCNGFISEQKEEKERVINCTKYCNTNSGINKFYDILEDKSQSTLICIQNSKNGQTNVLNLAGTQFHLGNNVLMLVLVPVDSQFVSLSDFASGLVVGSVSQVTKSNGKNIYKEVQPSSIYFIQVNEEVIRIIVQLNTSNSKDYFYAISLNVSSLYGSADASTQKSRRILKQQDGNNQLLYLSQSEYIFTDQTQPYSNSLESSISKGFQVITILSIILAILFMGQQMLYKVQNMVILMQTLPLILISINIRQLERSLYQLMYGFRWTIGAYYDNYSLNQIYLQQSYSTGQILLIKDTNVITNCLPYIIVLLIFTLFYFFVGILCMANQFLIFWRRARSDRKLQNMSDRQKAKQMEKQAQASRLRKNEINKKFMDRFYREEQAFTLKQQYTNRKTTSKENRNSNETLSYHYSMREKQREYSSITNLPPKERIRKNKKTHSQIKQKQKIPPLKNDHRFLDVAYSNTSPIEPIKSQMLQQKQPLVLPQEQSWPRRIMSCINQFLFGNQYVKYDHQDINHQKKLRILLIFILQASLIVFIYFSMLTLIAPMKYPSGKQEKKQNIFQHRSSEQIILSASHFQLLSKIMSVILLGFSFSYAIYKVFSDHIGALYVWKRVLLGLVLAFLMGHSIRILGCVLIQIVFTILRLTMQQLPLVKINQTSKQAKPETVSNTVANTGTDLGDKNKTMENGLGTKIDSKEIQSVTISANINKDKGTEKEKEKENSNVKKCDGTKQKLIVKLNKMHIKIRNKLHPYRYIISIIIEELLLILIYVLLAFTDTFVTYHRTDSNYLNMIIIGIITLVICSYLVAFCVQLTYTVIDNWYLSSLTHHQQIRKIRLWQYYQQYQYMELPLPTTKSNPHENNQNVESSRANNTDMSNRVIIRQNKNKQQKLAINDKYIEYYNQFMYRVYEDNEWMFLQNQQEERLLEQEQNYKDFYTAHRYADNYKVNVSHKQGHQPAKKYETPSIGSNNLGNKNVNMKNKQTFIFGKNKMKNRFSRPDQNYHLEPVNRPKLPNLATKYKQG